MHVGFVGGEFLLTPQQQQHMALLHVQLSSPSSPVNCRHIGNMAKILPVSSSLSVQQHCPASANGHLGSADM